MTMLGIIGGAAGGYFAAGQTRGCSQLSHITVENKQSMAR